MAARRVTPADGFHSPEDKKSFVRLAVGGGILLALAFAVSMALMLRAVFLQAGHEQGAGTEGYGLAFFQGEYWYLTTGGGSRAGKTFVLRHRKPGGGDAVEAGRFDDSHDVFLLAGPQDPGRLWICAQDKTGYVDGDGLHWMDGPIDVGDMVRPFFVGSDVATLSHVDGAVTVWTLAQGHWRKGPRFNLVLPHPARPSDCSCNRLKALWWRGSFLWFYKDGFDIRRFEGIPSGPHLRVSNWAVVVKDSAEANWAPVAMPGGPMLVDQERGAQEPTVRVWAGSGPSWKRLGGYAESAESLGLLGTGPKDWSLVLAGPGLRLLRPLGAGAAASTVLVEPDHPAQVLVPVFLMDGLIFLGPLALLFVLQWGLDRHRSRRGRIGRKKVVYASLRRRALARVLDLLLVMLGMAVLEAVVALGCYAAGLFQASGAKPVAAAVILVAMVFVGMLAGSLALVQQEGRSGQTPGRRLLGIRVLGTDLKPCGFQRAFLRALLSLVDGFWQWVVGLYVISFSLRYQRLGDLIGDTVVLRED